MRPLFAMRSRQRRRHDASRKRALLAAIRILGSRRRFRHSTAVSLTRKLFHYFIKQDWYLFDTGCTERHQRNMTKPNTPHGTISCRLVDEASVDMPYQSPVPWYKIYCWVMPWEMINTSVKLMMASLAMIDILAISGIWFLYISGRDTQFNAYRLISRLINHHLQQAMKWARSISTHIHYFPSDVTYYFCTLLWKWYCIIRQWRRMKHCGNPLAWHLLRGKFQCFNIQCPYRPIYLIINIIISFCRKW